MNKKFLKPGSLLLSKISQPVPLSQIDSPKINEIIQKMLKIAYGKQKDQSKPLMVGLAAPQIGIFKRIILVDVKANGKGEVGNLKVFINPKIIWKSKKTEEWYEGCYSTGKICGIVSRSISVKVKAITFKTLGVISLPPPRWDIVVEEKFSGYTARIFQHEIDHLDGKLFIDLIKDPNKLHLVKPEEFHLYRNKETWRNWPKKWVHSSL